jgi:RND superfamily putative drug exporter
MSFLQRLPRTVVASPLGVIGAWIALALVIGLTAPNLTRLAAEGQADLLPRQAESIRVAAVVARVWPAQSYQSMAVVALYRPEGLTDGDRDYARLLSQKFSGGGPVPKRRVLGPESPPEVARRMISQDRTMELIAVPLGDSFVSPAAHRVVAWLQGQADSVRASRPAGLQMLWTGDAVIGRDYMANVQSSLNRAAGATVVLLLVVLLWVYRSVWLALVPLATIAVSLVIARGVLAWLVSAGWEVSPLVELFLVVILFGSGTDFCLFLTWRFREHWAPSDPEGAMMTTLQNTALALITSAATVIAGLSLMATTRFKLFSSTGPSVALGLALTLGAALSLTPALLVVLARHHPRSFGGMKCCPSGIWDVIAHRAMSRPLLTWLVMIGVMTPAVVLGMRTVYLMDTLTEMPQRSASVQALRRVSAKFGDGYLAPLTVVLETRARNDDLRSSQGLELIDNVSRFLAENRRLLEIRSATQPLGSTALLDPARLSARLGEVNKGFGRMEDGARQLEKGLNQGVAKVRMALMLESMLKGKWPSSPFSTTTAPPPKPPDANGSSGLGSAVSSTAASLEKTHAHVTGAASQAADTVTAASNVPASADPRQEMVRELSRAASGAGQIADGAHRAGQELTEILNDPVGRHALDRLLITPNTVHEHPELNRSFSAYISPDGRFARLDLIQAERMSSAAALDQVENLRRRLGEYLGESRWLHVGAGMTGANAESADIRALTRSDQHRTWLIVPAGIFVILLIALRDPWACLNLVATMLMTYAFALGVTHLVFIDWLGDAGLDWKVPYFLFVLLVAVGVDYNVFLMTRLQEETETRGLREAILHAVAATGGLISSAAAITACSFASLMLSPLSSLRQLGFALVVGVTFDAVLVRPVLVPCGHWLMKRGWTRSLGHPSHPAPQPEPAAVPG